MRAVWLAALLGLLGAGLSRPASALTLASDPEPDRGTFDYLYTEANEGGSSGGHVAVRFGLWTYHFQNVDGLLVLERERTSDFLHDYALVNNRTVVASRVRVGEDDASRLRAAFDRRLHVQHRQIDVLRALEEDQALLETWARGEAPEVPGLGFFETDAAAPRSAAAEALLARIEATYGSGTLEARRREALTVLESLAQGDPGGWTAEPAIDLETHPAFSLPWSRRYLDAAAGVGAIDVLRAGRGLAPDATVAPDGPRFWLSPPELEALRAAREELETKLVRNAGSLRGDWGRPFLAGLARLLALDASIEARRLVVLDVLPDDSSTLPHSVVANRPEAVAAMLRHGHTDIEGLRELRKAEGLGSERTQARLEALVTRVVELEWSLRERRDLRLQRGRLLPVRPGPSPTPLPARAPDDPRSAADLEAVRARAERVAEGLDRLYDYQLLTRNCVSELFETINHALGDSPEQSEAVLGGYIDGHRDGTFVPFLSAQAVDARYRVVERRVLPSLRELRLEEMRREENDWWVGLRESNTLTAKSYRRGYGDSYFLFFTDDRPLLRPLLGAANLVAATFESLYGIAMAPVDRGETLLSGLEGILVSLPELAFWNIRKGSNDWVAPRPQPLDGLAPTAP